LGNARTFCNEHIPPLVIWWYSYIQEQDKHNQPVQLGDYFNETLRDTMENWQSEFLQLIWQVVGLSILWYVGSSQSKEADDRMEEKIDLLIQRPDSRIG
jgi:SNF2 family DNA or RNA helicase